MIALFFASLLLGYAAAGLASIVRALVPTLWLLHKPLSCDLCMSWWCSLALSMPLSMTYPMALPTVAIVLLAAVATSIMVLKFNSWLSDIRLPPSE